MSKIKNRLIFIYILFCALIVMLCIFLNSYQSTVFGQFEIKYVNTNKVLDNYELLEKNNIKSFFNETIPIYKRGFYTYCYLTIENKNSFEKDFVILEKGNVKNINLYRIENDEIISLGSYDKFSLFNSRKFFLVTLDKNETDNYIIEYLDKNNSYILPKIVDYKIWNKSFLAETALLTIFKVIINLSMALVLFGCIHLIYLKKNKNFSNFLNIDFLKCIIFPCLFYFFIYFLDYRFHFSNGFFFISAYKYLLLFTLEYLLFSFIIFFYLFLNFDQKQQLFLLNKELKQIKEMEFEKITQFDNYSKTVALENLGNLFVFFESMTASLSRINQKNYKTIIGNLSNKINKYKIELQNKYECFIPDVRLNNSVNEYENPIIADFDDSAEINICVYDFNNINFESYFSAMQANKINCIKFSNENTLIDQIINNKLDLLIIDPSSTGSSCFTLCKSIRDLKNFYEFPILLVSKFCSSAYIDEYNLLEINDFIIKPFSFSELLLRIKNLIYQKKLYFKNNELQLSEKEKRTFLYFITHNINTPLTILINLIDDISLNDSLSNEIKNDIEEIRQSAEEINSIIQNVFTAFRLNDGQFICVPQLINVNYIIDNIKIGSECKASKKNQKIIWEIQNIPSYIEFDRTSFWGITNNLIDNAIKFSPYDSKIYFKANVKDGFLIIDVVDEGPGIKEDEVDKIFIENSHISNKPTGGETSLGIGLNISYKLALLNHSSLSYKHNLKQGSCFGLKIPIKEKCLDER